MIRTVEINNFKSIEQLKLDCRRINILIGEPNTGKSNILESLGVFSFGGYRQYGDLRNFVRFEMTSNPFYDEVLQEQIQIYLDDTNFVLSFKDARFTGAIKVKENLAAKIYGDYNHIKVTGVRPDILAPFKFYKFAGQNVFPHLESAFLLAPSGQNLTSITLAHKVLRLLANDMLVHCRVVIVGSLGSTNGNRHNGLEIHANSYCLHLLLPSDSWTNS